MYEKLKLLCKMECEVAALRIYENIAHPSEAKLLMESYVVKTLAIFANQSDDTIRTEIFSGIKTELYVPAKRNALFSGLVDTFFNSDTVTYACGRLVKNGGKDGGKVPVGEMANASVNRGRGLNMD